MRGAREWNEKPANWAERGAGPSVLSLSVRLDLRVQIPAVLHFPGDDVLAGGAGDGAAQVGRQEVMNGPVPTAHAGADGLLLDVLRQCCPLLGQLGVHGSG